MEELVIHAFCPQKLQAQGLPAPAAVNLSPVSRAYPSRALKRSFQAVALRLFYQGTGSSLCGKLRIGKALFCTSCSPGVLVNNLGTR